MKRPDSKTRMISWPAAALLVVAYAISLARVVYGILALLFYEWSSYGGVVTVGTVVFVAAGLVALVVAATRHHRRNIGV